jgi:hypothetical protein
MSRPTGTMAITMAGLGSRFAKAGFARPKYEIEVLGRSLFDWSMLGLRDFAAAGWEFRFAARGGTGADAFLRDRCAALGLGRPKVLELDGVTDGQATTALRLAEAAPAERPLAIFNIDTFLAPGAVGPDRAAGLDGWLPCFPAPGEGWSFARLDAEGRVVELREKLRISDHATVGLYWFASAEGYREAYRRYYDDLANEEKGERYVAPLYNQLIRDGARVGISLLALNQVGMLGTPEQVAAFAADPPAGARAVIGGAA